METPTTKPKRGIRNKPIKKLDQYPDINDACPMPQEVGAPEVLVDGVYGLPEQGELQLHQDLHNTAMEKTDQDANSNDGCQKPKKGIRNKPIKKLDQYPDINDACPVPHEVGAPEVLVDDVCGIAEQGERQLHQELRNTAVEKRDQDANINDGCPMLHRASSGLSQEVSQSSIRSLNLEPVRGSATACFVRGSVLDCLGTSERMSADVSRPCATGPPGLGRRREYRSPAKINRDNARLNRRDSRQKQSPSEIGSDIAQDPLETRTIDDDASIEQPMMCPPQHGIAQDTEGTQSKDEPSPFSIKDLLKWRSVVLGEGLSENVVLCFAMCVESENPVPKNWRDDAALSQQKKNKDKKKWSKDHQPERNDHEDLKTEWTSATSVLKESENPWLPQRKQPAKNLNSEAKSDEEIVRAMKSILNKLTMKKYDTLYQQILSCGMSTGEHVKILIHEVLEKAESQHHFIQMYCQLCVDLHKWFVERKSTESADTREHSFRRILLDQCQMKFEDNLLPPECPEGAVREDEIEEAMIKHKHAMLGNIKFIGALLEKRMLADSVLIHVAKELFDADAPHTLESLACFLTAIGPTFDQRDFRHYEKLHAIFVQVGEASNDTRITLRIRFLFKDLLDLRKARWKSASPSLHQTNSQSEHKAR